MRISILTVGAIASVLTLNAFADTTSTVTSRTYVDAQDATKQTKIPLGSLEIDTGKTTWGVPHSLVSYPTTTIGEIGEYGIMDVDFMGLENGSNGIVYSASDMAREIVSNMIPTSDVIGNTIIYETGKRQGKIPKSGFSSVGSTSNQYIDSSSSHPNWFDVAGTGIVTRTSEDGVVGERKIFEASDLNGYHAQNLTQDQKDIQDISIPTVGAVMAAISANAPTLPTGTAGNVVTYNASGQIGGSVATYNGSTTYNASNDASKIAVMSAVQRKMTCARYVQNADQTAENCLLWNVPD